MKNCIRSKAWALCALLALGLLAGEASAQTTVTICTPVNVTSSGVNVQSCQAVDSSNPLPVTGLAIAGALGNNSDGVAVVTTGNIGVDNYSYFFNGTSYDRAIGVDSAIGGGAITGTKGVQASGMVGLNSGATVLKMLTTDNAIDGASTIPARAWTLSQSQTYNGTTSDMVRGNVDLGAVITLAAHAAGTVTSADQTNYNGHGIVVLAKFPTDTTCSTTVVINGKDSASGLYFPLLTSAAITDTAAYPLTVFPGTTAVSNVISNMPVPRVFNIVATLTGGSCAVTGTIGVNVMN